MKAVEPSSGKTYFFIEKCLPFGASISCAIFQEFSDALQHITHFLLELERQAITNYLDDFLFISICKIQCDGMMTTFLGLCKDINCPISVERTEWSTVIIVLLGTLLNGHRHCLCIPNEKRVKVMNKLATIKDKKSATIKELQQLMGLLNFLNRAIVSGRVFTRRMYAKLKICDSKGRRLRQHHHVKLDKEFRRDS